VSGSASNDGKLGDRLVSVVDKVRRKIHNTLGTRPWKVTIVSRTWSGGRVGVGNPTVRRLELDPVPMVEHVTSDRMGPAGREASGNVTMTEVSLSYTEAEIAPPGGDAVEYSYVLEDLRGTRLKPRFFVLAASPVPRRGDKPGDKIDWYVLLKETADMGLLDATDA